jgi:hypothetical protein
MKYVIVKINESEVPMIFGNDVDLNQVQFPWPIVSAGVGVVQNMFLSCQLTQTINGREYGSRGLKDEILMRAADYIGEENPQIGFNNLSAPQEIEPEQMEAVKESFASVPVGEPVAAEPVSEQEQKED